MKVLILSRALLWASYRQKLTELENLGVDVTAVVPSRWREGVGYQMVEPGHTGEYRLIQTDIRFNGHFHAHYYPHLRDILRRERPDVVHLDEEPYNLATYLGARASCGLGIPNVFFTWQNIHRSYPLPVRILERRTYALAVHALAGSDGAASVLRAKGYAAGITVVPQFGVDPAVFAPGPSTDHPFTIGFLNRLVEGKAPLLAVEALADLPPEVHMKVIGDGVMREPLLDLIHAKRLDERVQVQARIPSTAMPSLLHTLDVVVLPSITTTTWKEQFGRILIEAMACGVPVIGSDSGEIPNVIGDAGLVVPEGSAPALADTIRSLLDDAGLRAELKQRGRRRVLEHYTHARIAEKTKEGYDAALVAERAN